MSHASGIAPEVGRRLIEILDRIYGAASPLPPRCDAPLPIPDQGVGMAGLADLWGQIVEASAPLAAPGAMGHMDTAPHPAAALTDALVSTLNNNLLFHELSPFASAVEELLIAEFAQALGMPAETSGIFCSGGSLANLHGLFAACGGFVEQERRSCTLFAPDSAHASIWKAAAIMGLMPAQLIRVETDRAGRVDLDALQTALKACMSPRKIAIGVLGGTVTGAVDDLSGIGSLCREHNAWFHVDAVYGGALAYSRLHRQLLSGVEAADSLAFAPQKWLQVPRLSALALFRDGALMARRLGFGLSYSLGDRAHRGRLGLQGSRRADAVTLWTVLQVLGRNQIGEAIDRSIELTLAA